MAKERPQATAALVACMALALAGRARANDMIAPTEQREPTIVLHVANYAALPPDVLENARARVASVYNLIGVRTVWVDGRETVRRLQDGQLHVTVLLLPRDMTQKDSPEGTQSRLLGKANVPSGRAYVYCDRISALPRPATPMLTSLGDVIAHEVGHLVLRAPGHSPDGIMRAGLDVRNMNLQSFSAAEARIIRAALMAPH